MKADNVLGKSARCIFTFAGLWKSRMGMIRDAVKGGTLKVEAESTNLAAGKVTLK
jgi:hypothetical protein